MIIDGKITILIGPDCTKIEIRDSEAAITFVRIKLTPHQLSEALSRIKDTPCEIKVNGIERVGKIHECESFEFSIPDSIETSKYCSGYRGLVKDYAQKICPYGWTSDATFNSKDSFFDKEGKPWAKCTIRRWIVKE